VTEIVLFAGFEWRTETEGCTARGQSDQAPLPCPRGLQRGCASVDLASWLSTGTTSVRFIDLTPSWKPRFSFLIKTECRWAT